MVYLLERVKVFYLNGEVVQPQAARRHWGRIFWGFEQRQIVMDLATGQKSSRTIGALQRDLKSQDLRVELGGSFHVLHIKHQVSYALGLCHDIPS
jgi:hypothetical protein